MIGGYAGKFLWVDLSSGKTWIETPDEAFLRAYVGGYGIGTRLMYDRMPIGADPLGPDNLFGLVTGPLTGTPALGSSRYTAIGKSPLTGGCGDANSGGFFGPGLKRAGFDAVFVSGIADEPVYLLVDEGKAEVRDASYLWGKDSTETDAMLRAEFGKNAEGAYIGPAGERLSLIAAVMNNEGRAAGRSGLGAVMGSKRLKAVVARGNLEIPLADGEQTNRLRRAYLKGLEEDAFANLHDYGTCGGTAGVVLEGDAPVKNWGGIGVRDFPKARADRIGGDDIIQYQKRRYACYRCNIACGGIAEVPTGPHAVTGVHKPEYETLASFGSNCLNDNTESLFKVNDLCNRLGLDTISAGATVAFAIECFENGILTAADTDGLELRWGNDEAIVALTEKIGKREGIGDLLADGVKVAAQKFGRDAAQYAMHVGGQEIAMHSPLVYPGLALVYQLDPTPGRHTQGMLWDGSPDEAWEKALGVRLPADEKYNYRGKGETHRRLISITHTINMTGLCLFHTFGYPPEHFTEFMEAVVGWPVTMDELVEMGERAHQLRHVFNLREGINPFERKMPDRTLGKPPFAEGPTEGVTVEVMDVAREFLQKMAWDPVTAWPSQDRLERLGLTDLAEDLYAEKVPS